MTLKCPICKQEATLGEPDFPFCSERCRLIDLGRWASEEYRIPVVGDPPKQEADPQIDEDAE